MTTDATKPTLIYGHQDHCPACGSVGPCDIFRVANETHAAIVACASCPIEMGACTEDYPAYPYHVPYPQCYRIRATWPMWRLRRAERLRQEYPLHTWDSAFSAIDQREDVWWRGVSGAIRGWGHYHTRMTLPQSWIAGTRRWQPQWWAWLLSTTPGLHDIIHSMQKQEVSP